MRTPNRQSDRLRVFLYADKPELATVLDHLASAIEALDWVALEPVQIEPSPSRVAASNSREMREGDILVALIANPAEPTRHLLETVDRANQRELLFLPFYASGTQRIAAPLRSPQGLHLETAEASQATVRTVVSSLSEVLRLIAPVTDLRGFLPDESDGDPIALDLLCGSSNGTDSERGDPAHAARQQAARAIEARLFAPALAALARALQFDPNSAICAFWRARLLTATVTTNSLAEAREAADAASRLASASSKTAAIESASWWLKARLEAMAENETGLLEALDANGVRPKSRRRDLLAALRLLLLGGFMKPALEWIETASTDDFGVIDDALAEPLLGPLAPSIQTLQHTRKRTLILALRPLLESESLLLERWTKAATVSRKQHASAESTNWKEASLQALQEAVNGSMQRQLAELNNWGEALITDLLAARQARIERVQIIEADENVEDPGRVDRVLESVWPRLRERREELDGALRETEREIFRLEKRAALISESMTTRVEGFYECALRFERNAIDFPELVKALNKQATMEAEPLLIATAEELEARGIACDAMILPNALTLFTEEKPHPPERPALFRVEQHNLAGPVASRAGVYFHQVYRRSSTSRAS